MNDNWTKYFFSEHLIGKTKTSGKLVVVYFIVLAAIFSWSFALASANQSLSESNIFSSKSKLYNNLQASELHNAVLSSKIVLLNHEYLTLLEEKVNNVIANLSYILANKDVTDRGVVVTINDSQNPFSISENPNLMIIHNIDLLMIVNELWANNAKAIAVNDQRITADTEFKCIGSQIVINTSRISPPFIIKAIGNTDRLQKAVLEGYVKKYKLEKFGISVSVESKSSVTIPSSSKPFLVSD